MAKKFKILDPKIIPESLWDDSKKALRLPPIIAEAYNKIIDNHNLRELAASRTKKDHPVGGTSKADTDKHFAQSFDGSIARIELSLLNSHDCLKEISNEIVNIFSGYNVSLTDAPCGAGAAAFAYLTTIAELRRKKILPRMPLFVYLIGADFSEYARQYASKILDEIQPELEENAIFVTSEFFKWDATNIFSNTNLITRMTQTSNQNKRLLIIANFSGFLEQPGKRKIVEPHLAELFRHSSGEKSIAIWIEPKMNIVTDKGKLFDSLGKLVNKIWKELSKLIFNSDEPTPTCESMFYSPLFKDNIHNVTLSIMQLNLVPGNESSKT